MKLNWPVDPAAVAPTPYVPGVRPAVNRTEAFPPPSVFTVMVSVLFEKIPSPVFGAVNVTASFATGPLPGSLTWTSRGLAKAVPMAVLWLFPPLLTMVIV